MREISQEEMASVAGGFDAIDTGLAGAGMIGGAFVSAGMAGTAGMAVGAVGLAAVAPVALVAVGGMAVGYALYELYSK